MTMAYILRPYTPLGVTLSYREQMRQRQARRRRMGAMGYTSVKKSITSVEIFDREMGKHKRFKNLKGWTDNVLRTTTEGMKWGKQKTNYKNIESGFWQYLDKKTGHYAIVEFPDISQLYHRKMFKILYVDKAFQKKGIARRCMADITALVDKVDQLCKTEKKYDGRNISYSWFAISLVPNPFHTSSWYPENILNIDWSDAEAATECMVDETKTELPRQYKSATHQDLTRFYKSFGFVPCRELWYYEYLDTSYDNDWQYRRTQNVHDRTIKLGKEPLVYPASNVGYYEAEENDD